METESREETVKGSPAQTDRDDERNETGQLIASDSASQVVFVETGHTFSSYIRTASLCFETLQDHRLGDCPL